jgi:hypothetical protein
MPITIHDVKSYIRRNFWLGRDDSDPGGPNGIDCASVGTSVNWRCT